MDELFTVFGSRDELNDVLLCKKHTLGGALCAAADAAEFWEEVTVFQMEITVATISLYRVEQYKKQLETERNHD